MRNNWIFIFARTALILLFLIITVLQIFSFPGQFAHMRRVHSLDLIIEITLTGLVGLWMACGQLATFSLWKMVGFIERSAFYSAANLSWINKIVLATRAAGAIPILLMVTVAPRADDPGFFVMMTAIMLFLVTIAVIVTLLRDQIALKID